MPAYSLYLDGKAFGRLSVRPDGLKTLFEAEAPLQQNGVFRLFLMDEEGNKISLGIMEPNGRALALTRRLSRMELEQMGIVLTDLRLGELVRCAAEASVATQEPEQPEREIVPEKQDGWQPLLDIERSVRDPVLRDCLRKTHGLLKMNRGDIQIVAVPADARHPFALAPLFCLVKMIKIDEMSYASLALDQKGDVLSAHNLREEMP